MACSPKTKTIMVQCLLVLSFLLSNVLSISSHMSYRREQEEEGDNPYVFGKESVLQEIESENGRVRIFANFDNKSDVFTGISNYRLCMFEANPHAFSKPIHFDADNVFYIVRGEGVVGLLGRDQNRVSINVKQGDVVAVEAGTIDYVVNPSDNQKLQGVKLFRTLSPSGGLTDFYTVGGDQPESYYQYFSTEVLQAAFNTQRESLERIFGKEQQGFIIKAAEEQIEGMISNHSSTSTRAPFNVLHKQPTHSNSHGKLYHADENDYHQLKDLLNIQISVVNISSGSMMAPFYNSRATKVAVVLEGEGYIEMVSLKEQKQGQEPQGKRYRRIRSRLSPDMVFIAPAGHPMAIVAASKNNKNLELLCFEIHGENNKRIFVGGKNNIVNKMEKEAKELTFGVPSKFVDEVFDDGRQEEVFVEGPKLGKDGGGRSSI